MGNALLRLVVKNNNSDSRNRALKVLKMQAYGIAIQTLFKRKGYGRCSR